MREQRATNDDEPLPDRVARWSKSWSALYPLASFVVATVFMVAVTFGHLGQQPAEWWGIIGALYGFVPISYWGSWKRKRDG